MSRSARYALEAMSEVSGVQKDVEAIAHELAHCVLLFGRFRLDTENAVASEIDRRYAGRPSANQHEVSAIALQRAGLAALHVGQVSLTETLITSYDSLDVGVDGERMTMREFRERVLCAKVSPRRMEQFVAAVRTFEGFL